MDKSFLCFIWEHKYFDEQQLCSQKGQPIEIIHPGIPNENTGPDFLKARVKVGDTLFFGGIVISVEGSDWTNSDMSGDPDFSNVALHVTYRNIPSESYSSRIPILELNGKLSEQFLKNYDQFQMPDAVMACAGHLKKVSADLIFDWRDDLIHDLLASKVSEIDTILEYHARDWDMAFLHYLISNFDTQLNREGFQALSSILDYDLLIKFKNDITLLEALLLGQSGMLSGEPVDSYSQLLRGAFGTIEEDFGLEILDKRIWKTEGLPPQQSPAVKLAQLAGLIHRYTPIFSGLQELHDPGALLRSVKPSSYWRKHKALGIPCRKYTSQITDSFADQLIIQAYIPILFALGKATCVPDIEIQAIEHLDHLAARSSRKTQLMESMGLLPCRNAGDTLAVEYAMERYCIPKKCLQCPVGCNILGLKKGQHPQKELSRHSYIYN